MSTDLTRSALIDAAEAIFARDGFERASLREIMRAAEANPAAVHYHFGGKEGLLAAVLDRVIEPITAGRMRALDDLQAAYSGAPDTPLPLRDLAHAFLAPDFEAIEQLRGRGQGRSALVGRAYGQPTPFVRELMLEQFDPVARRFVPEFIRSIPHVPPATLQWRLRWCVVGVIVAMFSNADDPDGPLGPGDATDALQATVDVAVALLSAEEAAMS